VAGSPRAMKIYPIKGTEDIDSADIEKLQKKLICPK
jgi:hypothetical protein